MAKKNNYKNSNLPLNGSDKTQCDLNDISGIHQAYAKFKYGLDDVEFFGNCGKKKRKFKTCSDPDSRALPAATFGGERTLSVHDFDLYAAQITGFSPRNQRYFIADFTNGTALSTVLYVLCFFLRSPGSFIFCIRVGRSLLEAQAI